MQSMAWSPSCTASAIGRRSVRDWHEGGRRIDRNCAFSASRSMSLDNFPYERIYDVGAMTECRAVPEAFQEMELALRRGIGDDFAARRRRLHVV